MEPNSQEPINQEEKPTTVEEINQPQPEEEAKPSEEEPKEEAVKKPAKSKGLIALVIIFAILAAAGIGFGIWAIMNNNQQPAPAPAPEPTEPVEPSEPVNEEVELTDANIIKDLDKKINILFGSGGEQTGSTIFVTHGVHREYPLFTDGNLSDDARLSHIAIAIEGNASAIPATVDVVNTIISNFPELTSGWSFQDVQDNLEGGIFAKDKFESEYRDVFGSDVPHDALGSKYCPSVFYDESGYYFVWRGCGGTSPYESYYYKNRYTADGDHAYVYINAGTISLEDDKIYCEILSFSDYENKNKSACDDYTGGNFTIDASNHDKFAEYRFVFKKADNGTYYFEKVEKIS